MGTYIAGVIVIIAALILSKQMLGDFTYAYAIIAGLVVGIAIGKITEIYTSADYGSVKRLLSNPRLAQQLRLSVVLVLE